MRVDLMQMEERGYNQRGDSNTQDLERELEETK
eukprot:CAMPEP_0168313926 /NCGR_PEP_ID=MMETSP0210-20121227/5302_1 /TAXON_ID=40633 /ORGANISM="Condylostoma magnum, Strain COL2" /LENGTH=32 /DNA_ID= /DNA_START= /DNA_END= /DNA_ORIENTATION=